MTPTQYKFLCIYSLDVPSYRRPEEDGTYMPCLRQMRTVNSLVKIDYLRFVSCTDSEYKYNGYIITEEGKAAWATERLKIEERNKKRGISNPYY
jgi:hypothetical protein